MSGRDAGKAGGPDARSELLDIVRAARRSLIAQIGVSDRGYGGSAKSAPRRSEANRPKI